MEKELLDLLLKEVCAAWVSEGCIFSGVDKGKIDAMIKDYLSKYPELLEDFYINQIFKDKKD